MLKKYIFPTFLILFIIIITISINTIFNFDSVSTFDFNSIKRTIFYIPSYTENIEQYYTKIPGLIYNTQDDNFKVLQNQKEGSLHKLTFYKLGDLLSSWNTFDISPIKWIESKCHPNNQEIDNSVINSEHKSNKIMRFDYVKELSLVLEYRQQELPFIIYNVPQLNLGIRVNFTLHKLMKNIGISKEILIENSRNNQFMYFLTRKSNDFTKARYPNWSPPQNSFKSTFFNFLKHLEESEIQFSKSPVNNTIVDQNKSFKYLSLFFSEKSMNNESSWIKYSLPMLTYNSPLLQFVEKANINDVSIVTKQVTYPYRGIVCRFGMRGMTNAAHFDSKRNFVSVIRGRRRYILLPPSECERLQLYPKSHPSARHSSLDWANITSIKLNPKLYNSKAIETIVSMGEILFIPSYWFHYIITQDAVIQCNARTGESVIGRDILHKKCGFSQNKFKSKSE